MSSTWQDDIRLFKAKGRIHYKQIVPRWANIQSSLNVPIRISHQQKNIHIHTFSSLFSKEAKGSNIGELFFS